MSQLWRDEVQRGLQRAHDWLMHELNQSFCEQGVIESLDANLT